MIADLQKSKLWWYDNDDAALWHYEQNSPDTMMLPKATTLYLDDCIGRTVVDHNRFFAGSMTYSNIGTECRSTHTVHAAVQAFKMNCVCD